MGDIPCCHEGKTVDAHQLLILLLDSMGEFDGFPFDSGAGAVGYDLALDKAMNIVKEMMV